MGINTEKYVRRPLYVDAVRVTQDNFTEMVDWCDGQVEFEETKSGSSRKFIRLNVHNPHPSNERQKKAFVGDWILKTDRGLKIYTNKAFKASFEKVTPQGLTSVESPEMAQARQTIEAEGGTVEPATTQAIAEVINEQQPPVEPLQLSEAEVQAAIKEQPAVEPEPGEPAPTVSPTAPPPMHDGKVVITELEARTLTREQITDMLRTGEYILASDLAA